MEKIFLDKYQQEADSFCNIFAKLDNKRIVLYGIGRFTSTLIPRIKDKFQIVGLMDREVSNIGKLFFGLPVLSLGEVEKKADCIIINTTSTYWQTIFRRIKDSKIPVYFLNGELASLKGEEFKRDNFEYWSVDFESYRKMAYAADVVSFDLFDTLLQRTCYLPTDVFKIADIIARKDLDEDIDYPMVRQKVRSNLPVNYTWTELEKGLAELLGAKTADKLCAAELKAELRLCRPREIMKDFCNELIRSGKDVYIITDMYLPQDFIMKLLNKIGMDPLPKDRVWVSNEMGMQKADGTLWECFSKKVVNRKSAIHFGDDVKSDVEMAKKYGITACYVMSGRMMLHNSTLYPIETEISTLYESVIMGLLISRLFDSPFALNKSKGRIEFNKCEDIGYAMYAPLLSTFLFWLRKETGKRGIKNLYFFARDGYFLERDYKLLLELFPANDSPKANYLYISRQLAWIASIKNEKGFEDILNIPYVGTFAAYMKSRWDIVVDSRTKHINDRYLDELKKDDEFLNGFSLYKEIIKEKISTDRKNYISYLERNDFKNPFGVVDMGVYGTIHKYLSKILERKFNSWNIVAQEDAFDDGNNQFSCFEGPDRNGNTTPLSENMILVETLLTAPYGMVRRVDENGSKVCDRASVASEYFDDKVKMNEEVIHLLEDMEEIYKEAPDVSSMDRKFIAQLFMCLYTNGSIFNRNAVRSFIYENSTMHLGTSSVFD